MCNRWQRKRKTPGTLRQEFPECKNSFVFIFLAINFDLLEIFRIPLQHQETLLFIGSTLVPCQEKLWVDWHFDKFKLRLKSSQCSVSKQRKKEKISSKESRNQQQKSIWQWTKAEERERERVEMNPLLFETSRRGMKVDGIDAQMLLLEAQSFALSFLPLHRSELWGKCYKLLQHTIKNERRENFKSQFNIFLLSLSIPPKRPSLMSNKSSCRHPNRLILAGRSRMQTWKNNFFSRHRSRKKKVKQSRPVSCLMLLCSRSPLQSQLGRRLNCTTATWIQSLSLIFCIWRRTLLGSWDSSTCLRVKSLKSLYRLLPLSLIKGWTRGEKVHRREAISRCRRQQRKSIKLWTSEIEISD